MQFSREFLDNKMFVEQPLKFNPLMPERLADGSRVQTGVIPQQNGDMFFRIYAPASREVTLEINFRAFALKNVGNGLFEGVVPFDEGFMGPHSMDVLFDGVPLVYPYLPVHWHRDKVVNFVEFPDPGLDFCLIRDVPHGAVTYETYWSKATASWQRCTVYTPPGYMKGGEEYPVLYLQHGNTEDETVWIYNGRIAHIADNLIADGKMLPCIIVMCDSMIRYGEWKPGPSRDMAFSDSLLGSCIPHIENIYRVKTDRHSRALAGLSLGSYHAISIGLAHPEVFSSIGVFSGHIAYRDFDRPIMDKMLEENYLSDNYHLVFRSIGGKEDGLEHYLREDDELESAGIRQLPCYKSMVYEGQYHEFGCWRRAVRDYLSMLFKW